MDLTFLKVLFEKHGHFLGSLTLGALLFIAGWYTGRAMSPYYASHPIVFEDRGCENCASSGGSIEELAALREEGIAMRDTDKKDNAVVQATPSPAVAGTTDIQSAEDTPLPVVTSQAKMFVGSVNSDKYHFPDCPSAARIKEENKVWFDSQAEAEKAGYEPSACTLEKLK